MRVPGSVSLLFLLYLFVVLPWAALRSSRRLRQCQGAAATNLPARESVWIGTIISLLILLTMAWVTGQSFNYDFFAPPQFGFQDVAATLLALGASFLLRVISRAVRTEDERRGMAVYWMAPRTRKEVFLWSLTVLVAAVGEEVAYRGVAMSIMGYSLGNPWVAALLCALAFGVAHAAQGWKSGLIICAMALVMHALVAATGTLVFAMLVHVIYDISVGYLIRRQALQYDRERVGSSE